MQQVTTPSNKAYNLVLAGLMAVPSNPLGLPKLALKVGCFNKSGLSGDRTIEAAAASRTLSPVPGKSSK
jgi:hypothetical protein